MRRGSPSHPGAAWLLFCALACHGVALSAAAQAGGTDTAQLLSKAKAQEVRGRMDMARDTWKQVLLIDPRNAEALAGMARAAKASGNSAESAQYLQQLRAVRPNDPSISQIEGMSSDRSKSTQMQEASRLAQSGQYDWAMKVQRQMYGDNPPPGDAAISYYETEAGAPQGRQHAIVGLRAMVARFPQDPRYSITLGKILTYTPRTRTEGRRILERYAYDPAATEALRQSLLWDVQNPAMRGEIRAFLGRHPDPQLEDALSRAISNAPHGGGYQRPLNPTQRAEQAAFAQRSAEERRAYAALNAKRYAEADELFRAILAKHPQSCPSLTGLGYVRMSQSNFAGAISFLEQAEQYNCKDAGLQKALQDSRFFYTVQVASRALDDNDLFTAKTEFELALKLRSNDPSALLGMGGTLLKAQQPEQALPVFQEYIKRSPGDMKAWRGLMMAQFGANRLSDALDTERRIPPPVKAQLVKDPDYLRTLGSVYLAEGREGDAQRVFQQALNLPFPAGGQGLKIDTQLQFAALLATIGRKEQAAALYRQVVQADPNNANGWVGLVQVEHQLGHDPEAYQLMQQMPPAMFAAAMQEAGFETSVAAIYEGVGHDELAQDVLEKFLAKQKADGKRPFVPAEVQLAAIYLRRGNATQAYALYRSVLEVEPNRPEAWVGLLTAMHSTGHDQEALAQLQQISPNVHRELEKDPNYLQTVGSIYSGLGDERQAMIFFQRVQQHYASLHIQPPAGVQIQQAWLLYNGRSDNALYQHLMMLGGRQDLTDRQRLTIQEIWTDWAVRRAQQNVAVGDYRRAIAILNATAKAFPGNPVVIKALASGYASAGMAKEAVAIFRAQDMSNASATDYAAAIGAALAANDLRNTEYWLRFGLAKYPHDSRMLMLAAKFEQSRGDANRAAEYYKATLAAEPPANPGSQLANELSHAAPTVPAPLPSANQPQDLATLLSQPDRTRGNDVQANQRPYLPSFNAQPGVGVAAPMSDMPSGTEPYGSGWAAPLGGYSYPPMPQTQPVVPKTPVLNDFHPHSELIKPALNNEQPATEAVIHLHPSREIEAKYGPYLPYDPSQGVPHFTSSPRALGDGVLVTASAGAESIVTARFQQTAFLQQQPAAQESVPAPTYKPQTSYPAKKITPRQSARSRAAAIHQNQSQGQSAVSGQSHPPTDDYRLEQPAVSPLRNAQFSSQPYDPAQVESNRQVAQPQGAPKKQQPVPSPYRPAPPPVAPAPTYQPQVITQQPSVPESSAQQYPQPGVGVTANGYRPRRRKAPKPAAPAPAAAPTPIQLAPAPPAPPMNYPGPNQGQGYSSSQSGEPLQMGQPPSDFELQQRNLPPLRGYFDPRVDERTPLTTRQQAELALATIDGSYSGWAGGAAIGHYRSGRPGIDQLGSLEVPIEVSLVAGRTLRLSVIPKAVFLTSGQLDTLNNTYGSAPLLGTLPGNALTPPPQQFASGVGGEVQVTANTFAVAIGVTPYQFLVNNVIGRGQWRPLNSHFLIYGSRDSVKETQLSYAGMRDPGSASAVFSGNVWGGVVATGGGARFDAGSERAGLYLQGAGYQLTGYHVLDNRKFDGTMGMYFRVNTWPEYGSLNIGGLFYGEHFQHNERGYTYGLGGYFSPEAYFLAAIPITFNGHYGKDLHYRVNTSLGVQTFAEDNQIYFPLDPALQTTALTACTVLQLTARTCGQLPVNSSTGLNYSFDSELSYRVTEHWYVGGLLSANNTNNYNSVTGGFFARYMFHPQVATPEYPTGLFPVEGFRPLQVP